MVWQAIAQIGKEVIAKVGKEVVQKVGEKVVEKGVASIGGKGGGGDKATIDPGLMQAGMSPGPRMISQKVPVNVKNEEK